MINSSSMDEIQEYRNRKINGRFAIARGFPKDLISSDSYLMFLWNDGERPFTAGIDDRQVILKPGQITCSTYLHEVQFENAESELKTLFFNREFYCVHIYDSEVSCNGLLFFGSDTAPVMQLDGEEIRRLRTLYAVLEEEFAVADANQEEMLRILLKRFIIRCTRLAKKQILKRADQQSDIDLVRSFNVLVEEHFRTRKTIGEYAELMYKSPKTITNVFSKYSKDSPLQVIHKRIIMEAKRMLLYTDKATKEIGYELGYSDPAQFSKLFRKYAGMTTTEFRNTRSQIPSG